MKRYLLLLMLAVSAMALKAQTPTDTAKENKQIYTAVDQMPTYVGGSAAYDNFIKKNLRYPIVDKQNGIQGRVYINLIVEKDGSITNVKIIRTPSQTIADEALRLMLIMPKWNPGIQNEHPVRVSYTIPVNFNFGN